MNFEWVVALRFLREGRFQTALIIGGAAAGVAVVIFITALVNGLQANTLKRVLGTQADIVIRPAEEVARPQREPNPGEALLPRVLACGVEVPAVVLEFDDTENPLPGRAFLQDVFGQSAR